MQAGREAEKKKPIEGELALDDLKAFILSIEWEISDEVMTQFIDEVDTLKSSYRGDNVITIFLKLLSIIGKYIRAKKVASHPDSIKLLNSVYQNLDRIVSASDIDDDEKKRLLMLEAAKFRELKEKIALSKSSAFSGSSQPSAVDHRRPAPAAGMAASADTGTRPEKVMGPAVVNQALADLIRKEVKAAVRSEFEVLKKEIQSIMNSH